MDDKKKYSFITTVILCLFITSFVKADENIVEFETRALELGDDANINLSNFARADYIPEGSYPLNLKFNDRVISNDNFDVIDINGHSQICFPLSTIETFEFKQNIFDKLSKYSVAGKNDCILISGYQGITVRIDREKSTLLVTAPQALLKYSDPNWTPPSQWDDGITGVLFDYTLSGSLYNSREGASSSSISSYGTVGANYQAWRLRSNYQASLYSSGYGENKRELTATSYYLTRALKELGAQLTLGKSYFQSNVFESLDFRGVAIASDNRMLPPALRGYAPRLSGVAKTNAKVIVTRGDSIIYEKMVPPGPFVIEDLTDATSGELKMTVKEENGEEQVSTIETSNIPFLTRSGHIRYKAMIGRMEQSYGAFKPMIATAEASLGVFSNISLFGGALLTDNHYHSINGGIGYDMKSLGALSVDITHASASINNRRWNGESYRFNYSKVFDSIDSQITFAGYRFSDKTYLSLSNMAHMSSSPEFTSTSKESYNLVASKSFRDLGMSVNAIYNRQTYWQSISDSSSYGLSVAKSFDIGKLKNVSAYLSINRTEYKTGYFSQKKRANDSVYLSLSIPLDQVSYMNIGTQINNGGVSPSITYTNSADTQNIWSIGANTSSKNTYDQTNFNGNIVMNRNGYSAAINSSVNPNNYYLGGSIKSGMTATEHGIAVHRDGYGGNTRLMIDTDGVSGVYIGGQGYSQGSPTNDRGITVLNDIPDYYRTNYAIDTNRLPDDVESTNSNIQMVLTEGAIGYRKVDLYRGVKIMLKLTDSQGKVIPFGTLVDDKQQKRQVGVVGEHGEVYLSGINAKATLTALDSEGHLCSFILPNQALSLSSVVPVTCHGEQSFSGKRL